MNQKERQLKNLLGKMEIPPYKIDNYKWLAYHLKDRNEDKPEFLQTMDLLIEILQEKHLVKKKEVKQILSLLER